MKSWMIPANPAPVVGAGLLLAVVLADRASGQSDDGGICAGLSDANSASEATVDITADSMELLKERKRAVFTGNVDALCGKIKLKSGKLVVDYVEVAQKDGGAGKTEVRFLDATGAVTIVSGEQTITSDWAKMDAKDDKAIIGGNVVVVEGKSRFTGERLFLDLRTGQSRMKGGRVRARFFPRQ